MDKTKSGKDVEKRKRVVKEHRSSILREKKSETAFKKARRHFKSKKKHFLCPLPLRNRLPEPTPGVKLVQMPSDLSSFVQFKPTSLDREYKWKHHCERTLGVNIDLIDLETHAPLPEDARPPMHPDDDRLLKWDASNSSASAADASSDRAFFRKTQFMQNSSTTAHRGGSGSGGAVKRSAEEETTEEDATLAALIESFDSATEKDQQHRGFELVAPADDDAVDALSSSSSSSSSSSIKWAKLKHPSKPGVTAEWCLPVLPAAQLWANNYRFVSFDDDPGAGGFMNKAAAEGMTAAERQARLNAGLIVNAKNE
jgi:hypothetical protein